MGYLLDTDTISDLVRHPYGRVAARLRIVGQQDICTSIIVAAELRFGAVLSGDRDLTARIDAVLQRLPVLAFEPDADRTYAVMRAALEKRGALVGANDMLIAAHALALEHTLVTGNEREFSRIAGLRVENWLRPLAA